MVNPLFSKKRKGAQGASSAAGDTAKATNDVPSKRTEYKNISTEPGSTSFDSSVTALNESVTQHSGAHVATVRDAQAIINRKPVHNALRGVMGTGLGLLMVGGAFGVSHAMNRDSDDTGSQPEVFAEAPAADNNQQKEQEQIPTQTHTQTVSIVTETVTITAQDAPALPEPEKVAEPEKPQDDQGVIIRGRHSALKSGDRYGVGDGDTLSGIATRAGSTVEKLATSNNISNPDLIYINDVITIP